MLPFTHLGVGEVRRKGRRSEMEEGGAGVGVLSKAMTYSISLNSDIAQAAVILSEK